MQRMRYFDPHRSAYIPIQTLPDGRIHLAIRSVRAYKVREVKKPPAEQTEQLSFTAKKT